MKPNIGGASTAFMNVNDLNETAVFRQAFRTYPGGAHVRWQTRLRPGDGLRTMAHIPPRSGEALRRLQRTQLQLLGPVSMHAEFVSLVDRISER